MKGNNVMSHITCKVCGKSYSYCADCIRDMDKPRWMISFDTAECKETFDTLVKNSTGKISDSDALKKVKELNVDVKSQSILNHINKLSGKERKTNTIINSKKEEPNKTETSIFSDSTSGVVSNDLEPQGGLTSDSHKGLGSLFGKNTYTSNSKNKERTKEDAESITGVLNELDRKNMK